MYFYIILYCISASLYACQYESQTTLKPSAAQQIKGLSPTNYEAFMDMFNPILHKNSALEFPFVLITHVSTNLYDSYYEGTQWLNDMETHHFTQDPICAEHIETIDYYLLHQEDTHEVNAYPIDALNKTQDVVKILKNICVTATRGDQTCQLMQSHRSKIFEVLSRLYAQNNDRKQLTKCASLALQLNPHNSVINSILAFYYHKHSEFEGALIYFNAFNAKDKPIAIPYIINILAKRGNQSIQERIDLLNTIEQKYNSDWARAELIYLHRLKGQPQQVLEIASRIINRTKYLLFLAQQYDYAAHKGLPVNPCAYNQAPAPSPTTSSKLPVDQFRTFEESHLLSHNEMKKIYDANYFKRK